MSRFARVPIEALADPRLTHRDFRILAALLLHADKDGHAHPKLEVLAQLTGVDLRHVRRTVSTLVDLGYVTRVGNGGQSTPNDYTVQVPKTRAETALVSGSDTRAKTAPVSAEDGDITRAKTALRTRAKTAPPTRAKTARGIQQTNIQQTIEQKKIAAPPPGDAAPQTKKSALSDEMREACRKTWDGYSKAYGVRYGIDPVRNAKVAGQIVAFVKRVGMDDAPKVASFYPGHSAQWYVRTGHSVDAMLRDAEKLRTEWATGQRMSNATARQIDAAQANYSAIEAAKQLAARRAAP